MNVTSFYSPCFFLVSMLMGINVFGAETEKWVTVFDEQFADNPHERFHLNPVSIPGSTSSGGTGSYDDEGRSYAMGGHLSLIRPVQAGAHVELELMLQFRPPEEEEPAKLQTEFKFVLFDRTIVSVQLQRSKNPEVSTLVSFVKETSNQNRVIRAIQLPEAPRDGKWLLRFRHGLLTLVQGTNTIGSAAVGRLGVPVAGVVWVQRGGTVVCEQMILSGEPFSMVSADDHEILQQASQLNQEAHELLSGGHADEGLVKMKEASAMFVKVHGENHYDAANSYLNLAAFQNALGNKDEAKKLLNKALAIHEKILGTNHPHTTQTRYNLGESYLESGDKEKAEQLWAQCRDDWTAVFGPDYPQVKLLESVLPQL